MNSKVIIAAFVLLLLTSELRFALGKPVTHDKLQRRPQASKATTKFKTVLLKTNSGSFGPLGSTAIIHLNALKHKVTKSAERNTPPPPVELCVMSMTTLSPSSPKDFQKMSGPRGNTLFTSHNWGQGK